MNISYIKIFVVLLFVCASQVQAQEVINDTTKTKKRFWQRIFSKKDTSENKQDSKKQSFDLAFAEAVSLYDHGMPDSVLIFLRKGNLRNLRFGQATKTQKIEMYRLKALSAVLTDSIKVAKASIKKLLALDPNYRKREEDLADFLWYKDQMIVMPKLSFGLKVGVNATSPNITGTHSIFGNSAALNQELYNIGNEYDSYLSSADNWGIGFGLNLEYTLTKRIRLAVEGMYEGYRFAHQSALVNARFRRSVNYGTLMAQGKYMLPTDYLIGFKWQPYVHYGFLSRVLLSAIETETNTNTERNVALQTNDTAQGIFWGAGIRRTGKKSWIALEISRKLSPSNIANTNNRLINNEAGNYMFDFYQVGDDINIRNWEIQLNLGLHLNYKVFKKRTFKK